MILARQLVGGGKCVERRGEVHASRVHPREEVGSCAAHPDGRARRHEHAARGQAGHLVNAEGGEKLGELRSPRAVRPVEVSVFEFPYIVFVFTFYLFINSVVSLRVGWELADIGYNGWPERWLWDGACSVRDINNNNINPADDF